MRILRGVGSRVLSCGCLVGLYETYNGRTVAIVDAPNPACADPLHRANAALTIPAERHDNDPPGATL
jgi:hypothetical protein